MPSVDSALAPSASQPRADRFLMPLLAPELIQLILRELAAPLFMPEPAEDDPGRPSWLANDIWATEDQLAKCMRVSREFLAMCQPLLYANVRYLRMTRLDFVPVPTAVVRRLNQLLQEVKERPDLAALVQSLTLRSAPWTWMSGDVAWHATLQKLENLRHLTMPMGHFRLRPAQKPRFRPRLLSLDIFAEWLPGRETADLCATVPLYLDLAKLRRLSIEFFWTEDRRVVTWLESLPVGLSSLQLDVNNDSAGGTMDTAALNAILGHHGPSLGHLRLSADVSRTPGVALRPLSAACPGLVSFGWDTGTVSPGPAGLTRTGGAGLQMVAQRRVRLTTFLNELLYGGHPRLATLELGCGASDVEPGSGVVLSDPDFADALALAHALASAGALPRLRQVVLPHLSFAAGPLDRHVDVQARALHGCGIVLVDEEGKTWTSD